MYRLFAILTALSVMPVPVLKQQHAAEGKSESLGSKVSEDSQKAWHKTKEGTEKGWDATKEGAEKGWNKTKEGAASWKRKSLSNLYAQKKAALAAFFISSNTISPSGVYAVRVLSEKPLCIAFLPF